jgi:hypothetical protein
LGERSAGKDFRMTSASDIQHDADQVRRKSGDIYVQKLAKAVIELCRLCEEQEQKICKLESTANSG